MVSPGSGFPLIQQGFLPGTVRLGPLVGVSIFAYLGSFFFGRELFTTHGLELLGTVHNLLIVFLCCRVQTVEPECSIDLTSILIGQHLNPDPART